MFIQNALRPLIIAAVTLGSLSGCSEQSAPPAAAASPGSPFEAFASIQEIMASIIDPAADGVWDAVGTIVTAKGVEERQPHTEEEWFEVRHHALTLVEATNLLMIDGRRVVAAGNKITDEGFDGVLTTEAAQTKLDSEHASFVGFAAALHEVAKEMLAAVDARKPESMTLAGEKMDQVCEACHTAFWYPTQPIFSVTTNLK
ncbi:MAG TPA: hypothetical protein VK629_03480, partial [Steroidobacteraceae bacterium]|nr:hypothetical protein [Steroidobacteraceae bacterium]